ncbi:hypothetical protein [Streptomyces wedmorensis]
MAFWRRDGAPLLEADEQLTVVRPYRQSVELHEVHSCRLPVDRALEVLTRARRLPGADPATAFWGAAVVPALLLLARGRLLPGVSPAGFAWRIGPVRQRGLGASAGGWRP